MIGEFYTNTKYMIKEEEKNKMREDLRLAVLMEDLAKKVNEKRKNNRLAPIQIDTFSREIFKLAVGLLYAGINFDFLVIFDGYQIKTKEWDVICHSGSYGDRDGLLEVMGTLNRNPYDDVEGYLTAEDILKRILEE